MPHISTDLRNRLITAGLKASQVDEMEKIKFDTTLAEDFLKAEIKPEQVQLVYNTIGALLHQLPVEAKVEIAPQEDDMPTLLTKMTHLSMEVRHKVWDIYVSLQCTDPQSVDGYYFDRGRGYVSLKALWSPSLDI